MIQQKRKIILRNNEILIKIINICYLPFCTLGNNHVFDLFFLREHKQVAINLL